MSKASAYFTISDPLEKHDAKDLKQVLDTLPGVRSVSINEHTIAVDYDTSGVQSERLRKSIEKQGYTVSNVRSDDHIM